MSEMGIEGISQDVTCFLFTGCHAYTSHSVSPVLWPLFRSLMPLLLAVWKKCDQEPWVLLWWKRTQEVERGVDPSRVPWVKKGLWLWRAWRLDSHRNIAIQVWVQPDPTPPTDLLCHRCPWDWSFFQGNCYFFSKTQNDWNNSVLACQEAGARLVAIKSDEEKVSLVGALSWFGSGVWSLAKGEEKVVQQHVWTGVPYNTWKGRRSVWMWECQVPFKETHTST